jgi:UDP-2,3-diacylglucosamine hydrolase
VSAPAAPAVFEFSADVSWRAIDFISDLHLSAATPATFAAWAQYLCETPADAVFILGDLFEAWIGDDAREVAGSFEQRAAQVLREAASRRVLVFMAGNRDFLVGDALLRDVGMAALPDPTRLDAWGQRVLLTHGDALCLADVAYQAYRAQVRTPQWRDTVLALSLAERERLAKTMRDASAASQRMRPVAEGVDVDTPAALSWLAATASGTMVHGHTHRPADHVLAPGVARHVLSDWDFDVTPARGQVLRLTREGLARIDVAAPR